MISETLLIIPVPHCDNTEWKAEQDDQCLNFFDSTPTPKRLTPASNHAPDLAKI